MKPQWKLRRGGGILFYPAYRSNYMFDWGSPAVAPAHCSPGRTLTPPHINSTRRTARLAIGTVRLGCGLIPSARAVLKPPDFACLFSPPE